MTVDACRQSEPELTDTDLPEHEAACIRYGELIDRSYVDVYPQLGQCKSHFKAVLGTSDREALEDVLHVENLVKTYPLMKGAVFKRRVGTVHAVDGISFRIKKGETLGSVSYTHLTLPTIYLV